MATLLRLENHVAAVCGHVEYRVTHVRYRDHKVVVFYFTDNPSSNLDELPVSREDMDKVRKALELPEGTEPGWYEVHGRYQDGMYESEEDIDWDLGN